MIMSPNYYLDTSCKQNRQKRQQQYQLSVQMCTVYCEVTSYNKITFLEIKHSQQLHYLQVKMVSECQQTGMDGWRFYKIQIPTLSIHHVIMTTVQVHLKFIE